MAAAGTLEPIFTPAVCAEPQLKCARLCSKDADCPATAAKCGGPGAWQSLCPQRCAANCDGVKVCVERVRVY